MPLIIICVATLLLIPLISFLIIVDIKTMVYITLISIFFPIHIQLFGRDAITTGTICIFILFAKYLMVSIFEKKVIREKYDYWVYLLILLGLLSTLTPYYTGGLEKEQMGSSIRLYFIFLSSLLFFIVIKNHSKIRFQSHSEPDHIWLEKLLNVIFIFISIHIVISVCVKFHPSLGSWFKIFLSREVESFDSVNRHNMERIKSFVFGQESFGEILATLSPLIMYKIYKYRNPIWACCLLVFSLGLLFTVTRSGIVLFIAGIMISIFYISKEKMNKTLMLIYFMLSTLVIVLIVNPPILSDIFHRFGDAKATYDSGGTLFETLNRKFLPDVWQLVISKISLFGNGVTEYNFHNLFLTTLHRRGIAGGTVFFLVLLYPMGCLIKSFKEEERKTNKNLIFLCVLSMILFLINELKFEFTRGASYQQLCWCLFAIYYLASKRPVDEKNTILENPSGKEITSQLQN